MLIERFPALVASLFCILVGALLLVFGETIILDAAGLGSLFAGSIMTLYIIGESIYVAIKW